MTYKKGGYDTKWQSNKMNLDQIGFQWLVTNQIKLTSEAANLKDVGSFVNNMKMLKGMVEPFKDKQYSDEHKKLIEAYDEALIVARNNSFDDIGELVIEVYNKAVDDLQVNFYYELLAKIISLSSRIGFIEGYGDYVEPPNPNLEFLEHLCPNCKVVFEQTANPFLHESKPSPRPVWGEQKRGHRGGGRGGDGQEHGSIEDSQRDRPLVRPESGEKANL